MKMILIVVAVAILGFSSAQAQDEEPTANTIEPLSGSAGNKAQCPVGFYMTAMRITKDPNKAQQRAINIWCKEFPEKVNRGRSNKAQDEKATANTKESVGNKAQCPVGSSITAIQITKDPDNARQSAIDIWCTGLPEKAPRDEKPTANTKEPVGSGRGSKAQCPDDAYITAIQITKDPDKPQQRAINIWCTFSREAVNGAI